ncbi:hypothetical protein ID866_6156 [Astraeus odoratus]|nr:hypothetical protein ID866_6156 [Astraeus odoratus]
MSHTLDDSQLPTALQPNPEDNNEVLAEDIANLEEINALTELGTTLIQAVLEREPAANIKDLVDAGAPLWFQDNEGTSPLHAAAYVRNEQLVRMFLGEGAVWNTGTSLRTRNTAGDIALSMNDEACYKLIRDAGIRAELLLNVLASQPSVTQSVSTLMIDNDDVSAAGSTDAFLTSRLHYTTDDHGQEICLLELESGAKVGVMMGWEQDIMRQTVHQLCSDHPRSDEGLRVLNIGFGLGIIDGLFQGLSKLPALHVIIEAHPDVLAHMNEQGWHERTGVKIMAGKWQDIICNKEFLSFGKFDIVYTDTFAENYNELYKFFNALPNLMEGPAARFSFFNGLGATS